MHVKSSYKLQDNTAADCKLKQQDTPTNKILPGNYKEETPSLHKGSCITNHFRTDKGIPHLQKKEFIVGHKLSTICHGQFKNNTVELESMHC